MKRHFWILIVAGLVCVQGVFAAAQPPSMVIVPSHYRLVKAAFNLAQMRGVTVVNYQVDREGNTFIYVWDGSQWRPITNELFSSGQFVRRVPPTTIVIGREGAIPPLLTEAPTRWGTCVKLIETIELVSISNQLSEIFDFSSREWKRFAEWNELEIVDLNAQKRKQGRYGKPGTWDVVLPDPVETSEPPCLPPAKEMSREKNRFEPASSPIPTLAPGGARQPQPLEIEPEAAPAAESPNGAQPSMNPADK